MRRKRFHILKNIIYWKGETEIFQFFDGLMKGICNGCKKIEKHL